MIVISAAAHAPHMVSPLFAARLAAIAAARGQSHIQQDQKRHLASEQIHTQRKKLAFPGNYPQIMRAYFEIIRKSQISEEFELGSAFEIGSGFELQSSLHSPSGRARPMTKPGHVTTGATASVSLPTRKPSSQVIRTGQEDDMVNIIITKDAIGTSGYSRTYDPAVFMFPTSVLHRHWFGMHPSSQVTNSLSKEAEISPDLDAVEPGFGI